MSSALFNQNIQILILRKLLRNSQGGKSFDLFAKFGIGVIKYEVCINLARKREFKKISTICKNTSNKKTYSIKDNSIQQQTLNIDKVNQDFSHIEQIAEQSLLISGGKDVEQNRFQIYSQTQQTQDYKMRFSRYFHRTNYDKKNVVYIISGVQKQDNEYIDVSECEIFNLRFKTFKVIKQIMRSVFAFGCDQNEKEMFVFGGWNIYQN